MSDDNLTIGQKLAGMGSDDTCHAITTTGTQTIQALPLTAMPREQELEALLATEHAARVEAEQRAETAEKACASVKAWRERTPSPHCCEDCPCGYWLDEIDELLKDAGSNYVHKSELDAAQNCGFPEKQDKACGVCNCCLTRMLFVWRQQAQMNGIMADACKQEADKANTRLKAMLSQSPMERLTSLCDEAHTQEVQQLKSQLDAAKKALEPFAALLQDFHKKMPDGQPVYGINSSVITVGDLRAAEKVTKP